MIFKVPLKEAEEARKYVIAKKIYDYEHKPKRSGKFLLIPILKEDKTLLKKFKGSVYSIENLPAAMKKENFIDIMGKSLTEEEEKMLPSSYEIIGDILIINIPDALKEKEKEIGNALLKSNKNIKVVLKKIGIHEGEFRTQPLKCIAGENRKETTHNENKSRIKLNVETIYFSARLSTERKRIYQQVKPKEKILVMFSGSGPYPIIISRNTKAEKIIGIEKNPEGHKYANINKNMNKTNNVEFILGDVRDVVPSLKEKFDRILMPLPKGAATFLNLAFSAAKKGTIIHFYDFEDENEIEKGWGKVKKVADTLNIKCRHIKTVKCGQYSPGKFRICVDFKIE